MTRSRFCKKIQVSRSLLCGLSCLVWLTGCKREYPTQEVEKLLFSDISYYLGISQGDGQNVEGEIIIVNRSDGRLQVKDLSASCGCTFIENPPTYLDVGKTTIKIKLNLTTEGEFKDSTILLKCEDGKGLIYLAKTQVKAFKGGKSGIAILPKTIIINKSKLENRLIVLRGERDLLEGVEFEGSGFEFTQVFERSMDDREYIFEKGWKMSIHDLDLLENNIKVVRGQQTVGVVRVERFGGDDSEIIIIGLGRIYENDIVEATLNWPHPIGARSTGDGLEVVESLWENGKLLLKLKNKLSGSKWWTESIELFETGKSNSVVGVSEVSYYSKSKSTE